MQTVSFEEFMSTPVDEFPDVDFQTPGLTPRQTMGLVTGARIAGVETIEALVEWRRDTSGFSGEVTNIRELRQFNSFHLTRVRRDKDARSLEFATDELELRHTQAQVDAATVATTKFKSESISMAKELDEELGTQFFPALTAAVQDLSVDTRHMTWWKTLRSAMVDMVLISDGEIEWSSETHAIVYGKGDSGAEALASLPDPMSVSSGESEI